tara:strand:- start:861 stop:1181 length:321 start_codon:yes stop_codon:yes gene_type:complete
MGDRQREAYYRDIRLEKMTAATPTDRIELEWIVTDIRNRGVSVTLGTHSEDAAGFAAPIYNSDGTLVAAVTIGMPLARATREPEKYVEAVFKAGSDISKVLGYSQG